MKNAIATDKAPTVVGPYSQAIHSGDLIFLSGQIATSPGVSGLIKGSVADEVEQIMKNISSVLAAVELSLEDVVKTTIFMTDINDYQEINQVYARFFTDTPPARSAVAVKELPLGARVEIEAIASDY